MMSKYILLTFDYKSKLYFRKELFLLRTFLKWHLFKKNYYFFLNFALSGLYFSPVIFFFSNFRALFTKQVSSFFMFFSSFFWGLKNFFFRLFKAHGINMRIFIKKKNIILMRLGTSHVFRILLPSLFIFRVFKKRYFLLFSYNNRLIDYISYHFRYFRRFFRYKLIGLKYLRDNFKIKVGKKKAF